MKIAPELAEVLDSGRSLNTYDPIKVYFVPDGGTWYENGQVLTSSGWNSYEIQQAMLALQQWSNVADIQFVQTANQNTADFVIGTKDISGSTIGYFYLPGSYQEAGIGAFDNTYRGWSSQPGGGLEPGGNGFNLMLHEFGHGIGLSHPHSDSVMPGAFPGVSSSYDSGNFGLNQGVTTVMSYIDGWSTGPLGQTTSYTYGSASTPMPLDIAVVQDIYGANTTFASGNDTYTLPSTNQVGTSFSAIWDTGGIDTIVNPSDTAATIDLRPATLQVEAGGGGFVSHVTGIYGGLTMANSVVIENAVGGNGGDILLGNTANNTLVGNAGHDSLFDTLGNDTLRGGDGNDMLEAQYGINVLTGGSGNDHVIGGAQSDNLRGGNGDDVLQGDPSHGFWTGSDSLVGGRGDDILMGGGGADEFIFYPAHGNDIIGHLEPGSVSLNATVVATVDGADFVSGLDMITLLGFSQNVQSDVVDYVSTQNGNAVFNAEGTSITFYDVSDITADDFNFV